MFHVPEKNRVNDGSVMSSDSSFGNNGAFIIKHTPGFNKSPVRLYVIASDGMGWEHVSVSLIDLDRCPTWNEMCRIKDIFWDSDDCVIQYHPPKSEYVNNHSYCLHLWRPIGIEIPLPESILVGIK